MPQRPPTDGTSFHPVWYVTPGKTTAKVTCKVDLLAAVLSGIIDASSQVRQADTNLWTAARDNRLIAPMLSYPDRIKRTRRLFALISIALGALLVVPILADGAKGFRTIVAFAFVFLVLRESYKAAVETFELPPGRLILLYLGGVVLAITGFIACDALIELARLALFPRLEPDSDWLTLALFVGIGIVVRRYRICTGSAGSPTEGRIATATAATIIRTRGGARRCRPSRRGSAGCLASTNAAARPQRTATATKAS